MICLTSGCKINLGLRITGRHADGYHELDSIFYPLQQPCDQIILNLTGGKGVELAISGNLPVTDDNILLQACRIFAEAASFQPGLKIHLRKRVPVGAGLGGGSANCAALLTWLNHNAPRPLPQEKLLSLAAALGSDVPFFLHKLPCHVSGRGEITKPVKLRGKNLYLLLAWPALPLSTRQVFREWDKLHASADYLTISGRKTNNSGSILDIQEDIDFSNDLEEAAYRLQPELRQLKNLLMRLGASHAAMSGSGASHYGIFSNPETGKKAACKLREANIRAYWLPMQGFGA